jgi:hypothetical protein
MTPTPPNEPRGGTGVLYFLVLLLLVAGLIVWGISNGFPGTPTPVSGSQPSSIPPSGTR